MNRKLVVKKEMEIRNIQLIKKYQSLLYMVEHSYKPLSEKRKAKEEIRKIEVEMLTQNERFIHSIITKYLLDNEYEDAMQVGRLAYIRAMQTFKFQEECKFSSYAGLLIDNDFIKKDYQVNSLNRFKADYRATLKMFDEEGKIDPTNHEIAEAMHMDDYKFSKYIAMIKKVSLDTPLDDEDETTHGSMIKDNAIDVEETSILNNSIDIIFEAMDKVLKENEKTFIYERIYKDKDVSYIAKKYGYGECNVRRIIRKGLKELRAYLLKTKFNDYFEEGEMPIKD